MSKSIRWAAAAVLLLGACISSAEMPWAANWNAAKSKAAASGKLVMIDFWAVWCGPCKQMKATTLKDPKVIASAASVVPLSLDAEKEGRPLAERYRITSYPTFLFVDASGEEFGRVIGGYPAEPFRAVIQEMAGRKKDFVAMSAKVKTNPKDGGALARLAQINADRGNFDAANAQAAKAAKLGNKSIALGKTYIALGEACRRASRMSDAIGFYNKSLETQGGPKEKSYAHVAAAILCLELDRKAEARAHATAAKKIKGAPKQVLDMAGRVLEKV